MKKQDCQDDIKDDDPIAELSRMLYEDLKAAGDTPQEALTKAIRAISPLLRNRE